MKEPANTNSETLLDAHIDAARTLDESALDAAARHFRADLPAPQSARVTLPAWLRMAGATAVLLLAISLLPFLLPVQPGNSAFAQAQAWFERYATLHFAMTVTRQEQALSTVEVWSDESGATRISVPPVTHLVLPAENVMHTIMPGGEVMSRSLGIRAGSFDLGEGMEWLDELLTFQGLAQLLDEEREINGVSALGWRLELSGGTHTLWVDPADNRPLLLEATLPGDVRMESVFVFDEALPEDIFALPRES
jgi:hypothetical protein